MDQYTTLPALPASKPLKWLYCLTLAAMVVPAGILGASGAVGMATGGGLMGGGPIISLLLMVGVVYRIYKVVRVPNTLDSVASSGFGKVLCWLGILLMVVGLGASLLIFSIKPLTLAIFGQAEHIGAAFFVVGFFLYLFSAAGWLGIILFECGRRVRPSK